MKTPDFKAGRQMPGRMHHLDWLRVGATLLLIPFHSLKPFGLSVFYINATAPTYAYEVVSNLINLWHMPLFFLISGYTTAMTLDRTTVPRYIASRLRRLGIPLIVGMLTLVPLVGYLSERATKGIGTSSFLEYYPTFFRFHGGDLAGYTGGLSTHHLWFLVYLLAFAFIGLTLHRWLGAQSGRHRLDRIAQFVLRWPTLLLLVAIPLAAARASTPFYPSPAYYALIFAIGFLLSRERRLEGALSSALPVASGIAIAGTPLLLWALTRQSFDTDLTITFLVFTGALSRLATECVVVSWLVVIWWFAARFLNTGNRILDYLNTGSIAIYILHFASVVIVLRLLADVAYSSFTTFLLVNLCALVLTLGTYELLVRRFSRARFLFGIAPPPARSKARSMTEPSDMPPATTRVKLAN